MSKQQRNGKERLRTFAKTLVVQTVAAGIAELELGFGDAVHGLIADRTVRVLFGQSTVRFA